MGSTTQWPGNAQTFRARQQEVEVRCKPTLRNVCTKAKGRPGVYYREVGKRRRYEISYLDENGPAAGRPSTVSTTSSRRRRILVEVKSKLKRGERVAPAKLTFNEAADQWFAGKNVAERHGNGRVEPGVPATAFRPTARPGDHRR